MAFFKSVRIQGTADDGALNNIASTGEGHMEVAIHSPRMPFGEIHTESAYPIFQSDAVYGLNTNEVRATTGNSAGGAVSSSVTGADNLFKCSTGTTAYAFASLQSRKRLRYRAGQGIFTRFTAIFSAPAASSVLVAGIGSAESGFYFGYNGTTFGILHVTKAVREIQTLTVTTASTATNNYVVTLNDVATNVTATSNSSTVKTAYEISKGTYPGWTAIQRGSTVVFLANDAGNKTGAFSLAQTGAGTPAAGSFSETLAGATGSNNWIAQNDWNGDKLNGSGESGVTLLPGKGNVYQIDVQYLGFGSIVFKIEVTPNNGNNPDFVVVHTIKNPNALTETNISQPSFPFTLAASSAGSTTDVWVATASFAGFNAGARKLTGPRMTYSVDTNNFVGSTASTYYPLFTIRNESTYTSRANQAVVNILSISASHDDATPVSIYIIRNATLNGTPNFTSFAPNSCTYWDTAATTATISTNDQIVFSLKIGQASSALFAFEDDITLQPGETLTLAGTAVTGTATYVSASLNTREDQ